MPFSARNRGVTLVELIIALAILGILSAIAFPSFKNLIVSQRLRNTAFELNAALQYARSEAVTRRAITVVAPTSGGWQDGWTISVGTLVLKRFSGVSNLSISGPESLEFKKNGRAGSGQQTPFVIAADPAMSGVTSRCIRIDTSGLPKSRTGETC